MHLTCTLWVFQPASKLAPGSMMSAWP
jgi:hypothetical protein